MKAEARSLGFFACGIAQAQPVDNATAAAYRQWIADGRHADMHYLAENIEKRLDPTLLVSGARSIVVVAMSYAPPRRLPEGEYQLAAYALGRDYHDVVKQRLHQLCEKCLTAGEAEDVAVKVAVDTVPILERYWAEKAGIGFVGRNHQLIIPGGGSMSFLGESVTTAVASDYDAPIEKHCGRCRRCIDACPTGALTAGEVVFDASRCLSYQTIENRGPIAGQYADKLGDFIYGCDRCQLVCPWNTAASPTEVEEFWASDALLRMRRDDWRHLSEDDYRRLFKGSAVKRAKYAGLKRNIDAAEKANR